MSATEKSQTKDHNLAAAITRAASSQTYYTIRYLVDPERVQAAYQAYAYFRWLDDRLDQDGMSGPERLDFVRRQEKLAQDCSLGSQPQGALAEEETFLVDLMRGDGETNSGLRAYIRSMMEVMSFDAERRGRLISRDELAAYTRHLAVAVTEAMHYFIGHDCRSPQDGARYLAVSAAHITHMLRDTLEDVRAGYFNIPREIVLAEGIDPADVESAAYRKWVASRVELARAYFRSGRECLARVESPRCRLAGFAYTERFTGVLEAIERDDYHLREAYPECKSLSSATKMVWSALLQTYSYHSKLPYVLPAR